MIKRYERGSLSKLIWAHGSREIQVHGGRVDTGVVAGVGS